LSADAIQQHNLLVSVPTHNVRGILDTYLKKYSLCLAHRSRICFLRLLETGILFIDGLFDPRELFGRPWISPLEGKHAYPVVVACFAYHS